jgi:hypothetical protein
MFIKKSGTNDKIQHKNVNDAPFVHPASSYRLPATLEGLNVCSFHHSIIYPVLNKNILIQTLPRNFEKWQSLNFCLKQTQFTKCDSRLC